MIISALPDCNNDFLNSGSETREYRGKNLGQTVLLFYLRGYSETMWLYFWGFLTRSCPNTVYFNPMCGSIIETFDPHSST